MSGQNQNQNQDQDLVPAAEVAPSGGDLPDCCSDVISCVAGHQLFEWKLQQQDVTSRGRLSMAAATAPSTATPIHPLVPLLLYSERHFPRPPPYVQPAEARTHSGHHGNQATRRSMQVKKPLNAFMLYMKEMRHQVLQEGKERESAAINRILGRRWHGLSRSEQDKYYDLAQKERLLHMQLYPGWSAKDNYGRRKRRRSDTATGSCSRLKL